MVTNDIFLSVYLDQAEKAHSILKFLYNIKDQKEILARIRKTMLNVYEKYGEYIHALYNTFRENALKTKENITFPELVKRLQKEVSSKMKNLETKFK